MGVSFYNEVAGVSSVGNSETGPSPRRLYHFNGLKTNRTIIDARSRNSILVSGIYNVEKFLVG